MKFVFPIAGKGSRFLELADKNPEYKKPKPLIDVKGIPMIKRAVESFLISENDSLIFIVRKEHVLDYEIDEKLREIFGNQIRIIIQDTPPEGAAKTALLARDLINNEEEILITDSDFILDGKKYLEKIKEKNPDFAFPVFDSDNPKSSFVMVDENDIVLETAEKKTISRNAIIGSYYYKKGKYFVESADKMIEENEKVDNEFYISPIFNYLIKEGKKGTIVKNCRLIEMGTPELLEKSLKFIKTAEIKITEELIETMKNSAKKAGELVMQNFGNIEGKTKFLKQGYEGFDKIKKGLVSDIDFKAQKIILNELCKKYGDFSVLSEEWVGSLSKFKKNSEYIWVIDPIDGTANYLSGNEKIKEFLAKKYFEQYGEETPDNSDKFGICISLTKKHIPICSIIYYPKFDEFMVSIKGKGTFLGERKIEIQKKKEHDFSDAIRISQYSKFNEFKDLFSNRKSYQAASCNLRALLMGDIVCYVFDSIDYLDFCPFLLAYREGGGFIGDIEGERVSNEEIIRSIENGRIKKSLILCPSQEYCKSLLMNFKEKEFNNSK